MGTTGVARAATLLEGLGHGLAGLLDGLRDVLWPLRCLACGLEVEVEVPWEGLCADCARDVVQVAPGSACPRCALPSPGGAPCGPCRLGRDPPFERAMAATIYMGTVARLVRRGKFGRDPLAFRPLAAMLVEGVERQTRGMEADLVVPVPLSARRRRWRGFDQAEVLGRALARHRGLPLGVRVLVRRRDTPPQASLGARERLRNLRACFRVVRPDRVKGSRVLLVDDVLTTGATASACARALRTAGARGVEVAVVARSA
ncbi:MAG: ComF family protein [Planctomycetes bacterium]|nr:ComF family protein [Planctomycetota bacterium]